MIEIYGNGGITVKPIEMSLHPKKGDALITYQLRYPRFIHSEFMTHRVFSRNASSSRAIPVKTMLKQVWNDPAAPIHWGKNQPGMQANEELTGWRKAAAKAIWKTTGRMVCGMVWLGMKLGMHKQTANRLLEPWQFIHVVVTSSAWDNFYNLRDHEDAQPEIRELARCIKKAKLLNHTEWKIPTSDDPNSPLAWHLPYVTAAERTSLTLEECLAISVARCARVSYLKHDGTSPNYQEDLKLYDRLVGATPLHASPAEHQARAVNARTRVKNFKGWFQFRVSLEEKFANWK